MKRKVISSKKYVLLQAIAIVAWVTMVFVLMAVGAHWIIYLVAFVPIMVSLAMFDTEPKPKPTIPPLADFRAIKKLDKYRINIYYSNRNVSFDTDAAGVKRLKDAISKPEGFINIKNITLNENSEKFLNINMITDVDKEQREEYTSGWSGKLKGMKKEITDAIADGYEITSITAGNDEAKKGVGKLRKEFLG